MQASILKSKGWITPVVRPPKQWKSFIGLLSQQNNSGSFHSSFSKDWIFVFRNASSVSCMNFAHSSNICPQRHSVASLETPIISKRKHFGNVEKHGKWQTMLEAPTCMQAAHVSRPAATSIDSVLQKLAGEVIDAMERWVFQFVENRFPLPSASNPDIQLQGNFFPVPERCVQHQLPVSGKLPSCLHESVYIRNGANPCFKPLAGHHLFDGDGMLHAIKFDNFGNASYCCRFTHTHRLVEEERVGRAFFPKAIGELHGHGGIARLLFLAARSLCGLVDVSKGMGVANAGLVFFNGRLLAMSEEDLPYAVAVSRENGDLRTLGRYDFQGQLCSSMIAHPKKDPETGELFALSYDVVKKPYLKYFFFTADGRKSSDVCISLQQPTMMHDFAITKNFAVIPDQQLVFKMHQLLRGGSPVVYDRSKSSRFGILPKYDGDESRMKWIDVSDCFCFHLWNAWEESEEEVVVIGSCMTPPDCIFNESEEALRSVLCEIRLNLQTGISTKRKIANVNLEVGQVNSRFLGRRSRYAYLAIAEPWPKVSGIAKVDFESSGKDPEDKVIATFMHGENCYGGEPFFVPRDESDETAAEDDGFLLTFLHNEKTELSELLVLDASSPSLELIASVKLPSRVPYGFHGTFLTPKDLAEQTFCL